MRSPQPVRTPGVPAWKVLPYRFANIGADAAPILTASIGPFVTATLSRRVIPAVHLYFSYSS